ncbi:hypothetical protein LTS18_002450 [Coniosporium uncinatum]|uniref:Uncharacterized protein n=1 Tax=Coniosporium uncinatum TaxID=93489 RepID=A0ACC3DDL4_9PEZI|nr:hypothetical protein LTS18_002450 [Coniosporium uncinatum]
MRMFTPDEEEVQDHEDLADSTTPATPHDLPALAATFVEKISKARLTPAEIQGFLFRHRASPVKAVEEVEGWLEHLLASKVSTPLSSDGGLTRRREGLPEGPTRIASDLALEEKTV